jgi:hypothetical protein
MEYLLSARATAKVPAAGAVVTLAEVAFGGARAIERE